MDIDPVSPPTPVRKPTIIRVRDNPTASTTPSHVTLDHSGSTQTPEQVVLRQKPPPIVKPKPQLPAGEKPTIAKKPTISAKPRSTVATDEDQSSQASTRDSSHSRPKSLRVMEDKGHSQVAAALTDLLSKPRSSSKGLLHTKQYSQDDSTEKNIETEATPDGVSEPNTPVFDDATSPPRPKPKPRPRSIIPQTQQSSPPRPLTMSPSTKATTTIEENRVTSDDRRSKPPPPRPTSIAQVTSTAETFDKPEVKTPLNNGSDTPLLIPSSPAQTNNTELKQSPPKPATRTETTPISPEELGNPESPTPTKPARPSKTSGPPARPGKPPSRPPPPAVKSAKSLDVITTATAPTSAAASDDNQRRNTPSQKQAREAISSSTGQAKLGRRKLEITVLNARPISEVGFRELKISEQPSRVPVSTLQNIGGTAEAKPPADKPLHQVNPPTQPSALPSSSPSTGPADPESRQHKVSSLSSGNSADGESKVPEKLSLISDNASSIRTRPTIIRTGGQASQSTSCTTNTRSSTSSSDTATESKATRNPPSTLELKKDPWSQVAKGPGPADNPAFSTGDTPPPRSQGLPPLPVLPKQEKQTLNSVNELIDFAYEPINNQSSPPISDDASLRTSQGGKSLMDQSIEYKLPVDLQPTPTNTGSETDITTKENKEKKTPDQSEMSHFNKPSAAARPADDRVTSAATTVTKSKPPNRPSATPTKPKPPPSKNLTQQTASGPKLPSRPSEGHPLYIYMSEVPHGIAEYDYMAQDEAELSFKAGDLIELLAEVDHQWFTGRSSGNEGMFPSNYVKIIRSLNPTGDKKESAKHQAVINGPHCIARFDFDGETDLDLSFHEGDVIKLLERVDTEWYRGELNYRQGVFPASFVDIVKDLPSPVTHLPFHQRQHKERPDSGSSTGSICIDAMAAFDFPGNDPADLPLSVGCPVRVTAKLDNEWLYGQSGGRSGIFPALFVSVSEEDIELLPVHKTNQEHEQKKTQEQANTEQAPAVTHPIKAIAMYDFTAESDNELSLNAGDQVVVLGDLSADWCKGQIGDKVGLFPSAFVQLNP